MGRDDLDNGLHPPWCGSRIGSINRIKVFVEVDFHNGLPSSVHLKVLLKAYARVLNTDYAIIGAIDQG